MYIAFDGIDGSGKSTAAAATAKALNCMLIAQPSSAHLGPTIRKVLSGDLSATPIQLFHMFVADRLALHKEVVEPVLARGGIVVCDRSALSTYAYQGQKVPLAMIRKVHDEVVPKMDLAFVLGITVEEAQGRLRQREKQDTFDRDLTLQQEAARLFIDVANYHYSCFTGDIEVIDGSQEPEQIAKEVLEVIRACQGVAPSA